MRSSHRVLLLTLALALNNSGCGGGSASPPSQLAISVSLSQTTATIQAGTTMQLTATVNNDSAGKGVTWSVACSAGQCGSVSPTSTTSGTPTTYTAPATVPASGTITVTATSLADSSKSATATLTIVLAPISIGITGSTAVNIPAGATVQFTAVVSNDSTNKGVSWSVSCSASSCGSVSPISTSSGSPTTYTAPSTPPVNTLTVDVTATSVADPSQSVLAVVSVESINISVTPGGAWLPQRINQQFTATLSNDPSAKGVEWTLTTGGTPCSPACGSVSSLNTASGIPTTYTAPAEVTSTSSVALTATSIEDTTKSANAAITISAGTVEIVPSILDFGSVLVHQKSAPQVSTLTNIGNSTLEISSITLSGTNAGDYSQTNTCEPSIAAGMSCSITVTFNPTARGTRTAIVSVGDSSTDSPQQANLSGIGFTRDAANPAAVRSALVASSTAVVPAPSGTDKIGTRVLDLIDSAREEPFVKGTKRELLVRLWYPAAFTHICKPAEYTSPTVWNYFSKLLGVQLPQVTTNSCVDAPIAGGPHAVVVFTPGYTGTFTDYTFLFEDLASRGYVVASVDHTYEATAVDFPDGRFAKSVVGSHFDNTWRGDDQSLSLVTSVRLQDLTFVVRELKRLNSEVDTPFAGKLDGSRIAVAGHSMGGVVAFLALERDQRFRASIVIEGSIPTALIHPTWRPVLLLATGPEGWSDDQCRLWNNLRGPRMAVNLKGGEHVTASDAIWLAKYAVKTGNMGPDQTMAAIRDYVAAFLDSNLRKMPLDTVSGPSSPYPDATVATSGQLLCHGR